MTTQHTQGRLKFRLFDEDFCEINNAAGNQIGEAYSEANARRLVAAWNACEGVSTEQLENFAAVGAIILSQRDELLTALKNLMGMLDDDIKTSTDEQLAFGLADPQCPEHVKSELACVIACRAAIAKAEGGAA